VPVDRYQKSHCTLFTRINFSIGEDVQQFRFEQSKPKNPQTIFLEFGTAAQNVGGSTGCLPALLTPVLFCQFPMW